MSPIVINKKYRFAYPQEFVTLPEYSEHRGRTVNVLACIQEETEDEEAMYKVQASDGWIGEAFESELEELQG